MADYNFKKIEEKWQRKWEQEKVFEPEVNKQKKFFVTFPYPYINLSPHIGHFYTIMRVEALARYKRLCGFNVLFPQGWHATGSPIVSAAQRVQEREKKQIELLKKEGFSDKKIEKFSKPEHWIKIFSKKWKDDLTAMGLSIDWRRNFITTSLNPYYDKFIRWQFEKLKEKRLVEKGEHPVVWDPKTNMPVGDHDRIEGEGETPQEFCLFKFSLTDGRKIVSATLRPDTVLGITNIYVNPDIKYKEIETKGEKWIVGGPVIKKLENQGFDINVRGKVQGKDLIGEEVEFMGRLVPILPANFLNPNYGTGIVHSVPSDSADDLIALRDLQENDALIEKYHLDKDNIRQIRPIEIFKTPDIKGIAAQYFLDEYNVKNQNELDKLDKIRKELYKLTFNKSVFGSLYAKGFSKNLEGVLVSKGQKIIKDDLFKAGKIDLFYELSGKVVSRSLTECIVKIVSDQWFINYGDKNWKRKTHEALDALKLYPETVREQFNYVIDWLNDWACTREYGLGTRLPFDDKWLIESLSDSTIYMAYYTIAHLIKKLDIKEINNEFFDYIFLGRGKGKKKWVKLKKEFDYWYPLDFRNSGKDLVQNHLTFFLFNHVAIFPKKFWPREIGVNGWVRVDNQKMSKSIGNIISLREMAQKFGADASRLTILNGGEGMDDPNWDSNFASSLVSKFLGLSDIILKNYGKGRKGIKNIDRWFESVLNRYIKEATGFMEKTLFRSAIQKIFFDFGSLIRTYINKTDNKPNKKVFDNAVDDFLIMLSVFAPHFTEELWHNLGNKNFISLERWPEADESKIDNRFEKQEESVEKLRVDINNIKKITGKQDSKIYVYVLPNELEIYKNIKGIEIFSVSDKKKYDPQGKSKKAKPGKPAIYLE